MVILISSFWQESDQVQEPVRIGSKVFTESVILGEIARQIGQSEGYNTEYFEQLGGTRIVWSTLNEGEIDVYAEYTGTLLFEILADEKLKNVDQLRTYLRKKGIRMTRPLGFNNTYAIGMRREQAENLGIKSISDLKNHPELLYGLGNEFIDRADGWPGLRDTYGLNPQNLTTLEHELAYRGLGSGSIDVIDLYSTDAEIDYYDIKALEDDLNYFPDYEAVFLYAEELEETHPDFVQKLNRLSGKINEEAMIGMNADAKIEQVPTSEIAYGFLNLYFDVEDVEAGESFINRLITNTLDHLYLVGISLSLAILIGIPLGVLAVKTQKLESLIVGSVGILQTIPSLALLVFMIPLFGIGAVPAMAALFLYSLLPIVRNTHAGIKNIPDPVMQSALALGLPFYNTLFKIELPLAAATILAGIKTSAVINVGTATLGALIGAGGYGQPILQGIRLDSMSLILEGAIPAAVLAIFVQLIFDLIEKHQFDYSQ